MGLGSAALASLLKPESARRCEPGIGRIPERAGQGQAHHLPVHGRSGPAHLELLDHKPELAKRQRRADARVVHEGAADRTAPGQGAANPRPPASRSGTTAESGQHMTSLLPHIGSIADDICIVRSMQTEQINHDTAHTFMNSGFRLARPSQHGLMAALWPRQRIRGPARICGAHFGGRLAEPAHRRPPVEQRIPAQHLPRASSSTRPATPSTTCEIRAGVSREMQGELDRRGQRAERGPAGLDAATRKSPRGSPSTSWPSGCR